MLHRLLANKESTSDRRQVQAGFLKGDVVFAESDRNIVVGDEASGIIVFWQSKPDRGSTQRSLVPGSTG